jgi:hypothetical protein
MQSDACKYIDPRQTGTRKYDGGCFQVIAWKKNGMLHRQLTEITLSKTNDARRGKMVSNPKAKVFFSYLWAGWMRLGSDWLSSAEGVRKPLQDLPDAAPRLKWDGISIY